MARKAVQQESTARVSPGLPPARFESALAARREHYNQRFRMCRALRPGLDAEAFGRSLRQWVAPLVETLAEATPEHTDALTEGLFEVALALLQVGQAAVAEAQEATGMDRLWQLLARQPAALGQDPVALVGRLCNAWLHLQGQRGVRVDQWLAAVADLLDSALVAQQAPPPEDLLLAVQVLAWRCGMATFRQSALDRAGTLAPALLAHALGAPGLRDAAIAALLARLRADPWFPPEAYPSAAASPPESPPKLHEVGRVGGFRGLGGCFVEVPEVVLLDGRIALQDRSGPLQILYADACGAQLSADASGPATAAGHPLPLQWEGRRLHHPPSGSVVEMPAEVAGWACDGHTVAVVLRRSYWVRLYAVCQRGKPGAAR